MILTPAVGPVIDTAHVAETCANATTMTGPRRKLVERELLRIGGLLQDMRVDLAGPDEASGKLGSGFAFLQRSDDDGRFAVWVEWLRQYEAITETQALITATVLTEAA